MISNIFKLYAVQTVCDLSFNMLYIAENRYILQNNIPEFRGRLKLIQFLEVLIKFLVKCYREGKFLEDCPIIFITILEKF